MENIQNQFFLTYIYGKHNTPMFVDVHRWKTTASDSEGPTQGTCCKLHSRFSTMAKAMKVMKAMKQAKRASAAPARAMKAAQAMKDINCLFVLTFLILA